VTFGFLQELFRGGTELAKAAIAAYSGELVNTLKQFLRRQKIYLTFNTWEWQDRGALHLHLVVVCPDPQLAKLLPEKLQQKWFDILENISAKSQINLWERATGGSWNRQSKSVLDNCCKTIQCEKSPAAYLSKYVGKGSNVPKKKKQSQTLFYPSSWWSISDSIRVLIEKHSSTFTVRLPVADAMQKNVRVG